MLTDNRPVMWTSHIHCCNSCVGAYRNFESSDEVEARGFSTPLCTSGLISNTGANLCKTTLGSHSALSVYRTEQGRTRR